MDKKKLLALAIFLIMGFFMITFANPSDQLTPVDNNANEPVANNSNANQTTPTDNARNNQTTTPATNAGTTTTPTVTPVVDDNTDTQPTNDDEKEEDPKPVIYTVTFVDYEGNALKIQPVLEHGSATADDIKVEDYTVNNMTYTFKEWDKDFTDVTKDLTVKAKYSVKSIVAVVVIDGEKTDKTVEVYVNKDTENKKDVKLTDENINDYINVEDLPEENAGETNTAKELKYDKEDGYVIEIETELIDYTITTDDWTKVNDSHTITANIDEEVTLSHEERDGYTFKDYVVEDGNNVYTTTEDTIVVTTNDINVYSEYTVDTYKIDYELNKGIVDGVNPTEYTVEDEFELINPTREGYIFLGWTEGNSTNPVKKVTIKEETGDKKFTANWKAETGVKFHVTIREQNLDGTYNEYEDTTFKHVGYTDEVRTIKAPKAKYGFELVSDPEVTITITYDGKAEAVFTYNRVKFDVTFKAHDFTEVQRVTYEDAAATPTLEEANKKYNEAGRAFTFSQWGADYSKITGDTEVDAVYVSSPITYNIVYKYTVEGKTNEDGTPVLGYFTDRENANQINHATYNVTEEFDLVNPSKTGYDFVKWTDEEGNTVTEVSYEYGDKTLIAVFKPSTNNQYRVITYAERLEVNENASNATDRKYGIVKNAVYNYTAKATTGASIEVTPAAMPGFVTPAKQTYTIAADGTTTYTFFYDRQQHTLTFKLNGEVMNGYPQTLRFGEAITAPTLSAEEGYTLTGFGTVAETMGETDLTYSATITPNTNTKYTVVVNEENADGTTTTTRTEKTGTTGTTVTEYQVAKTGFILDATSKDVFVKGDGTATVTFNYTRERHNVTFKVNGTALAGYPVELRYGATITEPTYTVPTGYDFSGWTDVATNMGTEDLEYDATQTIQTFNVTFVTYDADGKEVALSNYNQTVNYGNTVASIPANQTLAGYKFLGWKDSDGNDTTVAITKNTKFKAQLVKLIARKNNNADLAFSKAKDGVNQPELIKDSIKVTLVNLGGTNRKLEDEEYKTDFNNTKYVKNKVLNITYLADEDLTNSSLKYSIVYYAASTKFEVSFNDTHYYNYTNRIDCDGKNGGLCNQGTKVSSSRYQSENFLEITEHYNQEVEVKSVKVTYVKPDGTPIEGNYGLTIQNGTYVSSNEINAVRWSYREQYVDVTGLYTREEKTTPKGNYPQNAYIADGYRYRKVRNNEKCNPGWGSSTCKYYVFTATTDTLVEYSSNLDYYKKENDSYVKASIKVDKEYHDPVYIARLTSGWDTYNVMDKNNYVINQVIITYHRDAAEGEAEGDYVVTFNYDSEKDLFWCESDTEVK